LLDRAFDGHPTELDLAERAVPIRLEELDDAEGALSLVERVRAEGMAPHEPWDALAREARIAVVAKRPDDREVLEGAAEALIAAGIAKPESARAVARDLAGAVAAGVPYGLAESTWVHARRLASGPATSVRAAPGSGVPLAVLPAVLSVLAGEQGPASVFVVIRGQPSGTERARRSEWGDLVHIVRLDALSGGPGFAGSAGTLEALLELGALLESAMEPGPIAVDVSITSLSDTHIERTIRIAGELGFSRLRIDVGDAWTARLDWRRVERYLAEPLHASGIRIFPAPEVVIRAESEEEAERLAGIGSAAPGSRCTARGVEIRCIPTPDGDARGSLFRIARGTVHRARSRA
jgi:hypothetical protein